MKNTIWLALAVLLASSGAALAYDYGYDPNKVPGPGAEGHYAELARDPQQIVYNGQTAWEYVVTLWNAGAASTGTTYEMWGFENDLILNKSYPGESWHGGDCDNIIMECWSGYGIWSNDYDLISPTLAQDGSTWGGQPTTGWAMPYPTDSYGAPLHVPDDYVHFDGGFYGMKFHTGYLLEEGTPWTEAGLGQGAFQAADPEGSTPKDCIPIRNYWNVSVGGEGVMAAFRVVTTETFGDDPGDSPIPQFSYARPSYFDILGNFDFLGDFDDDGDVNDIDIDTLCDAIRTGSTNFDLFDISADGLTEGTDGVIDTKDLDFLVRFLVFTSAGTGTEYGDFNLDGKIDNTDLTRLATNYGADDWGWDDGNANRNIDTNIDNTDLTILATYYGFGEPDVVPEPASAGLLLLGALAVLRRRRKAKR